MSSLFARKDPGVARTKLTVSGAGEGEPSAMSPASWIVAIRIAPCRSREAITDVLNPDGLRLDVLTAAKSSCEVANRVRRGSRIDTFECRKPMRTSPGEVPQQGAKRFIAGFLVHLH